MEVGRNPDGGLFKEMKLFFLVFLLLFSSCVWKQTVIKEFDFEVSYSERNQYFFLKEVVVQNKDGQVVFGSDVFETDREQELFFAEKLIDEDFSIEGSFPHDFTLKLSGGDGIKSFSLEAMVEDGAVRRLLVVSRDRTEPYVKKF